MSELRPSFGNHAVGLVEDRPPRIVVLIPCYNEEITIGKVVAEFLVPHSHPRKIFVYDNNSNSHFRGSTEGRRGRCGAKSHKGQGKCRAANVCRH